LEKCVQIKINLCVNFVHLAGKSRNNVGLPYHVSGDELIDNVEAMKSTKIFPDTVGLRERVFLCDGYRVTYSHKNKGLEAGIPFNTGFE